MCYFNFGLKTSSPGMVSISQSLFNSTLESRNSLFSGLLLFRGEKKKTIRTLDEICNPSYTNLRSPRRVYNLIPKQAAKRGNSPRGGKKTFFSFLLPPLFEFLRCFPGLPTVHRGFAPSSSHHWEAAQTVEVALVQLLTLDLGTCISFQWCSSVWLRM